MSMTATSNPTVVKVTDATPRPAASLAPDIASKQDPGQTEADFLRDLDRVSSNKGKERLASSEDT
jgi:hypothetical protein